MGLTSKQSKQLIVERIVSRGIRKRLFFGEEKKEVDVSRWACVSVGNTVELGENEVSVVCQSGKAQLFPIICCL